MNTKVILTVAFVIGISVGGLQTSYAGWFGPDTTTEDEGFIKGSSTDQNDRPSGVMRYFTSGDPMNECLWDIVASEACQRGILFDNQQNMNKKLNWLLEKQGYDFGQ
jgi:hypothetical protein